MSSPHTIRFGVFELDLAARQLRKNGTRIKLQGQPFRVLQLLLERPGEVVTREELKEKLWSDDTFVEFDHSLNTSVQKIRQALHDSAERPTYIETVPRVGYRFIAPAQPQQPTRAAHQGSPTADEVPAASVDHIDNKVFAEDLEQSHKKAANRKMYVALGAVFVLVVAGWTTALWRFRPEPAQETPYRQFTIEPRGLHGSGLSIEMGQSVISPNGRFIAYEGLEDSLWVYDFASGDDRKIEEANGDSLSWSPDSQWICYVSRGQLFKISTDGGAPQRLADIAWPGFSGSSWSPDGRTIVFSAGFPARLYEVASNGGRPQPLFESNAVTDDSVRYQDPHFAINDSRSRLLLYSQHGAEGTRIIVATDLDSGERNEVESGEWSLPFYSPTGHLLLMGPGPQRECFALPFSAETLQAQGDPFPISRIWAPGTQRPSVSQDGTLVHAERRAGLQQLAWVDRQGNKVGTIGDSHPSIDRPRLSPDSSRIVAAIQGEDGSSNLRVFDLERNSGGTPLTFEGGDTPVWTPDGSRIVYRRRGGIFIKSADGSEDAQPLLDSPGTLYPFDLSRDGHLVYDVYTGAAGSNILYAQIGQDGEPGEAVPFADTNFDELSPALSPNGRFLAYESDESGRYEVYMQPFPKGGRKTPVSTQGGRQPRWRGDGRELFYVEPNGLLVAVPVTLSPEVSIGARQGLFREPNLLGRGHTYEVAPDGQRFIVRKTVDDSGYIDGFRVIQNWFAPFRD